MSPRTLSLILILCGFHCALSDRILKQRYGWLQSPNYPREYYNDQNVTWTIEVREGYRIKLQFTWFDLEDSFDEGKGGACAYDYVTVVEGAKTLGRFCGNSKKHAYDAPHLRKWIHTERNKAKVNFVADFSNGGERHVGFKAHYVEVDVDECAVLYKEKTTITEDWDKLLTCNHYCHNVPGSYYCTCRYGFTLNQNNHTCVATFCENRFLTQDVGLIQSPEYPLNYAKLSHCSWIIKVAKGLSVHIAFEPGFEIEKHPEEGCVYDKLMLSYKGKTDVYCGTVPPQNGAWMDMQANEVKIEFVTDLAVEGKGFRLNYNVSTIRCLQAITAPTNGTIVSDMSKGFHEFSDFIRFSCDRGFDLTGEENITCLSDGTWDNPPPICVIKSCGAPKALLAVKNSRLVRFDSTKTHYLDKIRVVCDKWYDMVGGTARWICEDDKKWIQNGVVIEETEGNLPLCKPVCGVKGKSKTGSVTGFLSGGLKTTPHEFPWVALLVFGSDKANGEQCGASLISSHYVLTAAHCLNSSDYKDGYRYPNATHVWLGVHKRLNPNATDAEYFEVAKVIVHPEYHVASIWDYDVALLRLKKPVVMSEARRPVCLPSTPGELEMAADGKYGIVAGWGSYDRTGRSSNELLHAEFPVVNNETCWETFGNHSNKTGEPLPGGLKLTENMFCAGILHSQSTCRGDSGGPFVMKNETTHTYYQLGLVSFGIKYGCGRDFIYSGYARLNADIVRWIMETTNNLE